MTAYIIGIVVLLILGFFFFRSGSKGGNFKYVPKGDPNAQGEYMKMKFPKLSMLSAKEILDLSWKFLYDITEVILSKFSVRDQQEIVKQGRIMVDNGMRYQHVVDSNPKIVDLYAKKSAEVQKESAEIKR